MKKLFSLFALVALAFSSCNTSNSADQTLRVMCYNVRNCKGLDLQLDYDRSAGVINNVLPDIVVKKLATYSRYGEFQ